MLVGGVLLSAKKSIFKLEWLKAFRFLASVSLYPRDVSSVYQVARDYAQGAPDAKKKNLRDSLKVEAILVGYIQVIQELKESQIEGWRLTMSDGSKLRGLPEVKLKPMEANKKERGQEELKRKLWDFAITMCEELNGTLENQINNELKGLSPDLIKLLIESVKSESLLLCYKQALQDSIKPEAQEASLQERMIESIIARVNDSANRDEKVSLSYNDKEKVRECFVKAFSSLGALKPASAPESRSGPSIKG